MSIFVNINRMFFICKEYFLISKTMRNYTFLFALIICVFIDTLNAQIITVLSENFSGFTRSDVTVNNRAKILHTNGITSSQGWTFSSGTRQMGGSLKIGQGNTIGYVTTPKLNLSRGTITVNINAAQWIKPSVTPPATYKVAVLIDDSKVGEFNVGMAWRDVNHTEPFNNYSITNIPAATSNSRITIEVGNPANGGTLGNTIILDKMNIIIGGEILLVEAFDNFSAGYSWTWNQTWDGSTTYTNNSPSDLYPFIIGEVASELDNCTLQSGWKGEAIFEDAGKVVIGWEQKWNSTSTEAAYPGYLTTPSLNLQVGDVLSYVIGANVGLLGAPSAPNLQVIVGGINSTKVISTPKLVSSSTTSTGTLYSYIFTESVNSPITFKLNGTSTKDEVFLSSVKIERNTTGFDLLKENGLYINIKSNKLVVENSRDTQVLNLYSMNGSLINILHVNPGINTFQLNKGMYILKKVKGLSVKIVI